MIHQVQWAFWLIFLNSQHIIAKCFATIVSHSPHETIIIQYLAVWVVSCAREDQHVSVNENNTSMTVWLDYNDHVVELSLLHMKLFFREYWQSNICLIMKNSEHVMIIFLILSERDKACCDLNLSLEKIRSSWTLH